MTRKQLATIVHKALLAAFVLAAAAMADRYFASVDITNKLSRGIVLIVHCKSGDDDLGPRALEANATFGMTFHQNFFGGTLFWCDLAVEDKRLSFTAFDESDHETYVKAFEVSDGGVDGVDSFSGEMVHVCGWRVVTHLNF
ncbi:unnamed protein product [Linum tenue]|uniref:S-protein homolog n=1 Tax=Linum tenue TaxID=586396 RepID=A0AAV0L331_9ROSI|nr:unnamed protein product [Linum tenue]